ncbi:MAG: ATP-binding protein [Calditrichia bacterium]
MFGAFVQENGDANREFEGTGLGLALAQKFTGLMNGSISVESEPGFGSTFRLVLPDVSVEESSAQPVALPDEILGPDLVPDLQNS